MMEKSMKAALDAAMNDLFKDWQWAAVEEHSFSCSSAVFRFRRLSVRFLRPVEDRRKSPFPEIRLRFQNREGHAETARNNGKMKIPYYTAPCVRERVSRISWTKSGPFSAVFCPFGAGGQRSGNQMLYWTPPEASFTYSNKSAGWQSNSSQILEIFCKAIYLFSRKDCMTPSDSSFSLRSLFVL